MLLILNFVPQAPSAPPKVPSGENDLQNTPSWRRSGSARGRSEQNLYQIQPPPRNFSLRESVQCNSTLFEVVACHNILDLPSNMFGFNVTFTSKMCTFILLFS